MTSAPCDHPGAVLNPWVPPAPLPRGIEHGRISLRYWEPSDAQAMLEALNYQRESFLPWLPWTITENQTVEACANAIERQREKRERADPPADDFTLGVFERESNKVLGGTGLHRVVASAHEGEIGYWMRADRRREGLCAEAVALLISWAFTEQANGGWGLRRMHIRCASRNTSSRQVPAKLGLRAEAVLKQERWVPTIGWDDTLVWGVLRDEWDCKAHRLKS